MLIKSLSGKSWILRSVLRIQKTWLNPNSRCFSNITQIQPKRHHDFLSSTSKLMTSQYCFYNQRNEITGPINTLNFDQVSDDTIDSLAEYFDELLDAAPHLKDYDVNYGDGVLTVKFGEPYGTYVINRQTPNQQIWLSSPTSGPKRYDFDHGQWIYRHDGISLHQLLDREIGNIMSHDVDFSRCSYSGTQGVSAKTTNEKAK